MSTSSLESPLTSSPCPAPGVGVHSWLMAEANRCRIAGLTADDAERRLAANITRPPKPANEIQTTVAKAYAGTWIPSRTPTKFRPKRRASVPLTEIAFDSAKLAAIAGTIAPPTNWRHWLWERSPKRPETQNAFSFLAHLYRE